MNVDQLIQMMVGENVGVIVAVLVFVGVVFLRRRKGQ